MIGDNVQTIWEDFNEKCVIPCDLSPPQVKMLKGAFYAAFEAALLCVMAAPFKFKGDGEKMQAYFMDMMKETSEHFDRVKAESEHGRKSE
jgi:hypothetical protein